MPSLSASARRFLACYVALAASCGQRHTIVPVLEPVVTLEGEIAFSGSSPVERDFILSDVGGVICRPGAEAALICLGDQPQVQERSVRRVCEAFQKSQSGLIVPSYQMRRGHPWLVARPLWEEILNMRSPESPRDFLNKHAQEIEYVDIDHSSILEDLDTPEDYLKFKP